MKPASRKRKPREPFRVCGPKDRDGFRDIHQTLWLSDFEDSKEARKLAAWLVRAADYLDQKGPK